MSGIMMRTGLVIAAMGTMWTSSLLAEQFTPPDLEGYTLHVERDADGDGDGVNETRVQQYFSNNGDSAFSLTTQGQLWAWSLDTRDDDSGTRNYVIRDSDCDGVFDEVYGLDDEFHLPPCIQSPPAAE